MIPLFLSGTIRICDQSALLATYGDQIHIQVYLAMLTI